MLVNPGVPAPPRDPPVVSNLGINTVRLSWGLSPDDGGARVNGWAIHVTASPAPPRPPSPNPPPPPVPVIYVPGLTLTLTLTLPLTTVYVPGVGIQSFTIGVDQAYSYDGANFNPVTPNIQLHRCAARPLAITLDPAHLPLPPLPPQVQQL